MNKNYEEIIKELEKAELSIQTVKNILNVTENTKIINTQLEFLNVIDGVATLLAKSDNSKTINGVKHRLMKLKKFPNVKEAYAIQEKFGIPIYAWKDISMYKKTLPPR